MRQALTSEQFEQRIAAFRAFARECGFTVRGLGTSARHGHHFLIWNEAHAVEIRFLHSGAIHVSLEKGKGMPTIHPRLLPWVKGEHPASQERGGRAFSRPAWEAFFDEETDANEAADQKWIAEHFTTYRTHQDLPSYGSPTIPVWVTHPVPATLHGMVGTVSTLAIEFDTTQSLLREEFAIFLRDRLAQGDVLLGTVTLPVTSHMLYQAETNLRETGKHLTTIQLFFFQPKETEP